MCQPPLLYICAAVLRRHSGSIELLTYELREQIIYILTRETQKCRHMSSLRNALIGTRVFTHTHTHVCMQPRARAVCVKRAILDRHYG